MPVLTKHKRKYLNLVNRKYFFCNSNYLLELQFQKKEGIDLLLTRCVIVVQHKQDHHIYSSSHETCSNCHGLYKYSWGNIQLSEKIN